MKLLGFVDKQYKHSEKIYLEIVDDECVGRIIFSNITIDPESDDIKLGEKIPTFETAEYKFSGVLPFMIENGVFTCSVDYTEKTNASRTIPPPPPPPPSRMICNACGELKNGKHTSPVCRFVNRLFK